MNHSSRPELTDENIRSVLSASRIGNDPRTAPAVSLILGYYVTTAQLNAVCWPDLHWSSHKILIRDPKGRPSRWVEMTSVLVPQLLAVKQHVKAARPFGRKCKSEPPVADLLQSLLNHVGLADFNPSDLTRWSLRQSEETRKRVVTA